MFADENAIKLLTDNYKPVNILGKGSYGITLECINTTWQQDNIIIKIQVVDNNSKVEFYMNNFINQLRVNIPDMPDIFTQTYITLTSNKIPELYLDFIKKFKEQKYLDFIETRLMGKSPYMFIGMAKNDYTLHDLFKNNKITKDEAISYVFILLIGLMKVREYYFYFNHRDIKSDNIMFVKIDRPIRIKNVDNYIDINVPYFPKLIDYGRMTNSPDKDCNRIEFEEFNYFALDSSDKGTIAPEGIGHPPSNDVFRIVHTFHKLFPAVITKDPNTNFFKTIPGLFEKLYETVSKKTKIWAAESNKNDDPWNIDEYTYIRGSEPIAELIESNKKLFNNCPLIKFVKNPPAKEAISKKSKLTALCNTCYRQGVTMMYNNTVVPCFFCNEECEKKFGQVKYLMEIK